MKCYLFLGTIKALYLALLVAEVVKKLLKFGSIPSFASLLLSVTEKQ